MTDQILIAKWAAIMKALDCRTKKTAKKKCKELGIKVLMVGGVAHVSAEAIKKPFRN